MEQTSMTKYKRTDTKNGRVMYFVNGDMVSPKRIPENVLSLLESNTELELALPPLPEIDEPEEVKEEKVELKPIDRKVCVFDDKPAVTEKFINQQLIGLCQDHRQGMTTGKIAQAAKEKQS